jgi:uncharacterized protein YciI
MMAHLRICGFALALLTAACVSTPTAETQAAVQSVFVITYKPGPAWQAGMPMNRQALGPHAAYWTRLAREGRAVGAGPFTDMDGGIAVINAANLEDAQAIMAADPAVTSGVFVGEVHGWSLRIRGAGELPR